jgi:hypothetical protein
MSRKGMVVMSVSHRALDGSRVTFAAPGVDLTGLPSSIVVALVGKGRQQEFTVGSKELGASVAALQEIVLNEELSYQGGTLRIGSRGIREPGVDTVARIAVWEGRHSSIFTVAYGRRATTETLVGLFDLFRIEEYADGTTLTPRNTAEVTFEDGPELAKRFPQLGLVVTRRLTARAAQNVPRWRGTPVAGGDLYVVDKDTQRAHFVLVAENAITTILPNREESTQTVADKIAGLKVRWEAA